MKITNAAIYDIIEATKKFSNAKGKTAFVLFRVLRKLQDEIKDCDDQKNKLIQEYGKEVEGGIAIPNDDKEAYEKFMAKFTPIIKIYCEIQKLILAETSYCNALNTYVRGLNTKEQIAAVKYGQEITDQAIKTNMDTVIAQGNAVMEGIVKQYLETAVPETKTDVKDTENTTDGTDNIEDAATEKSSKKA